MSFGMQRAVGHRSRQNRRMLRAKSRSFNDSGEVMDARTRCTFDLSAILQKLEVRTLVIHEHPEHSVTFDLSQILQKLEIRHIGWSFDIFASFQRLETRAPWSFDLLPLFVDVRSSIRSVRMSGNDILN